MIDLPVNHPSTPDVSSDVAEFLRLMADSNRRRIYLRLLEGETCNCELVDLLGLPQNLISHHLRQLRRSGLVQARRDERDARWIYYSVDRTALQEIHRSLTEVLAPERVGQRTPLCQPGGDP